MCSKTTLRIDDFQSTNIKVSDAPHFCTVRKLHEPAILPRPWGSLYLPSLASSKLLGLPKDSDHAKWKNFPTFRAANP